MMRHRDVPPRVVSDLMTEDLLAVLPDDRLGRARDVMLSVGVHAVLVMMPRTSLPSITSTDLIDNWPDEEPVATVMTPAPVSITVEASVREAAELMLSGPTHHLVVVDGREVVGILSSFDLLEALTAPVADEGC
jgi:CBS domain-containing protein